MTSRFGDEVQELSRLAAARVTQQVVLRRGTKLGMYVGCGFPKSGTVWLCHLLSTALGLPYPQNYRSPIVMSSVIHAHWRYSPRLPPTAYVRRDGRDVMVSLYFHEMRTLSTPGRPRRSRELREQFERLFGPGFSPDATRENLPRFIEFVTAAPRGTSGLTWHQHIQDWWERPRVATLRYEELQSDPVDTLTQVMGELGAEPDKSLASLAVDRWSFARTSGRQPGEEDLTSFKRKGVTGDWVNHFTREAGEVFDAIAGDTLVALNYAIDRDWYRDLRP